MNVKAQGKLKITCELCIISIWRGGGGDVIRLEAMEIIIRSESSGYGKIMMIFY